MIRILALTSAIGLTALPAGAQDDAEEGLSLMERGARLFLEGMMQEMEPAMDELRGMADKMEPALREFAETMGPALRDLMGQIDDLSNYHPPEMLPNGDIILRRKTPDEITDAPNGEIEL